VHTGPNLELLDPVEGRQADLSIEVRVGIINAVQGVVAEHDLLADRDCLAGAIATQREFAWLEACERRKT
jgi:hypothetical protein